ncbi:conserved protein of unknown function [Rhodovastum atsumiense]|uniref:Uncharacterized protein n=1 Tax=Rhodovastum atsumiense TaxID=504468 RepID=A0A5M6IS72_9PROT|nr:hypothetical protein [Rhodovastum atsumiense]KAA5611041.1 hypothetical protein F1189_16660 [Rhodovastum atsumiense]CAH2600172.1 conserved protein of unknown function [Rhodovastum atsumiense]
MSWPERLLAALLVALLAGCGDLPRPFMGNPGATARRLAQPPPARLAVAPPTTALLSDEAGSQLTRNLAEALQAQEVPAIAEKPGDGDWRLVTTAELREQQVVPVFTVQNPAGEDQGAAQGAPVPAAAWAQATPALLHEVATQAAPGIGSLLTRIEAARRQSDPNSLVNRPARVFFKGVAGAPGDGDTSLARQMRDQLPRLGPVVQDTQAGADYVLDGHVAAVPIAGKMTRVEIQWLINAPDGRELGRVLQLNEVPTGSLDGYWGDVAVVVVQEAAGGVNDVLIRQSGGRTSGG